MKTPIPSIYPAYDAYREVISNDITYHAIAIELQAGRSVIIGWTDQEGSHHDILFALRPTQFGNLQRGLSGLTDLFVGVIGAGGVFGFDANSTTDLHPGYMAEKLQLSAESITTTKIAELITGVRKELQS